ncbi:hypothetical protein [Flavobacterium sp. CAU 1735]|uniref:hypothetical protein n=1 Tax=Flavobacterium sp. CAU 1735 TaxID=3140361 RepID=UPI003261CA6A
MKYVLFLLASLLFVVTTNAQNDPQTEKKVFANQGEQEKYRAEVFFKENYIVQSYPEFSGKITEIDFNTFKFDDQVIVLDNINRSLKPIFLKGLLYPQIIADDISFISSLEELKFLNISPKVKRFKLWLFKKNVSNPTVYLLEITNEQATEKTDIKTFIENGKLTFLKKGWTII